MKLTTYAPNQYVINTDEKTVFQSYSTIVATLQNGKVKTFKQCLSCISGNDLSELDCLIVRIKNEIQYFCHVSEYLPESFTKNLEKVETAINKEIEKRGKNVEG